MHLLRMGVSVPLVSKRLGVSNRTIIRALDGVGMVNEARLFSAEEYVLRRERRPALIERRG